MKASDSCKIQEKIRPEKWNCMVSMNVLIGLKLMIFFRGGSGGLIKRLGISTSYWNYNSFGGHFLLKATWNYGKVECWNTGYEKRKTPFYSN